MESVLIRAPSYS